MLKNKKAIYILIPLNIAVWGFFIYRFYTAYNDLDMPAASNEMKFEKQSISTGDSTVYKLSLNYKDPFLKNGPSESRRELGPREPMTQAAPKPPKVEVAVVPPKQIPEIKYVGLIKNSSNGTATALVSINGESKLVKPNDAYNGVIFKAFNKDSLVAKWGKEKIVVRR
jgi:hypothetical protein